ncbi:unnamed protein product [Soboliphyme baturini]|uniref:Uncharacterized protein n=1 Tax=Soboliphyme baturini TaxID=241478 RepID=A0A183IMT7_9BILA|nr:unnamed protein product [Soboliphyme baturini]
MSGRRPERAQRFRIEHSQRWRLNVPHRLLQPDGRMMKNTLATSSEHRARSDRRLWLTPKLISLEVMLTLHTVESFYGLPEQF